MKTVALRKAAKAKSNGNGNGKKRASKRTKSIVSSELEKVGLRNPKKIAWPKVPKPNLQDFKTFSKDKKGRPTKKTKKD